MVLPALIFSTDFLPDQGPLNGRRWSAQLLLRLWLEAADDTGLDIVSSDERVVELLRTSLPSINQENITFRFCPITDPSCLKHNGALFIPDPSLGAWASWRQCVGHSSFSLIGQTHTLSTSTVMSMLDSLVYEPVQEWDALICSSTAARNVVEVLLHDRFEQLRHRCGATHFPKLQLPVIPLPLDEGCFLQENSNRHDARNSLGIPVNDAVVLWLGRLSMLTKADPWPAYKVLQRVAVQLDRPLWLIECGPDDTSVQAEHFARLRQLCPDVNFLRLGGDQPVSEATKSLALVSCDLVLSLVDNIQETFGLSVAEAMAASRPVVVSNWDGYKDLVRDGVDGYLVPSRWDSDSSLASFPLGWMQKQGLSNFPHISGSLAQLVQLDLEFAEAAVLTLLIDRSLANAMGKAARINAESRFSHQRVMRSYLDLFDELSDRRKVVAAEASSPPLRLDPVRCFSGYASQVDNFPSTKYSGESLPSVLMSGRQPFAEQLKSALPRNKNLDWAALMARKHLGL